MGDSVLSPPLVIGSWGEKEARGFPAWQLEKGLRTLPAAMAGVGPPFGERRPAGQHRGAGWASVAHCPPLGSRVSGLLGTLGTVPKGRRCVASAFLHTGYWLADIYIIPLF